MGNNRSASVIFRQPHPLLCRVALAALSLVSAAGCASSSHAAAGAEGPSQPTAHTKSAGAGSPSPPALPARDWGEVQSLRYSLLIRVPDWHAWQVDDQTSRWFLLRHVPTHSELRVRTWRAGRMVHPVDCERQARLWRPEIPLPKADAAIDRRRLSAPSGYTTLVVAGVEPVGRAGTLEGYVLAFGSTVGRCFAFVYTTRARAAGAEAAIGDRLALMTDGVLASVRIRSIADRVH